MCKHKEILSALGHVLCLSVFSKLSEAYFSSGSSWIRKTGNKVSLQINQGSNKQPLLQLLPAVESVETANPVFYLQCALVTWQKSFHGQSPFFWMVKKRWSSPVGDIQLAGVGKYFVMHLMVFEQIAVVHLSNRMKLGEMRRDCVLCLLKYKAAGLDYLRQTNSLSDKADHAVYYKSIRGLCPITSWDLLPLPGWWTWIFVKWPKAHVCTSMEEPIQQSASCPVTYIVIPVCWHPKSAEEWLRQRTDRSIYLAVIDWLQFPKSVLKLRWVHIFLPDELHLHGYPDTCWIAKLLKVFLWPHDKSPLHQSILPSDTTKTGTMLPVSLDYGRAAMEKHWEETDHLSSHTIGHFPNELYFPEVSWFGTTIIFAYTQH